MEVHWGPHSRGPVPRRCPRPRSLSGHGAAAGHRSTSVGPTVDPNLNSVKHVWAQTVQHPFRLFERRRFDTFTYAAYTATIFAGPSLFRVVLRFFQTRLIISCLVFTFCLAFGFIGPVGRYLFLLCLSVQLSVLSEHVRHGSS